MTTDVPDGATDKLDGGAGSSYTMEDAIAGEEVPPEVAATVK